MKGDGVKLTKAATIRQYLASGPKTGAQIAEVVDDITPCVARTMAQMSGVRNLRSGRGNRALYALTDAGRAALARRSS